MKVGEKATRKVIDRYNCTKEEVTFDVIESRCTNYGNRTCTVVIRKFLESGNEHEQGYDTRYFHGTLEDFINRWEEENLNTEKFRLV